MITNTGLQPIPVELDDEGLSTRILKSYNRVLELLSTGAKLEEVLIYLVDILEDIDPDLRCSILLLDEKTQSFNKVIGPSLPDFYNNAVKGLKIGKNIGSCGAAAYSGECVIVENIFKHVNWNMPGFRDLAKRANICASWSQPILSSRNKVLGTFALYYSTARRPTDFDLLFIKNTAHIASIAIEKCYKDIELLEKQSENLLLLKSAGEGIFGLDKQGRITFINPAALRMLGYEEEEVKGKNLHDLEHHLTEDGEVFSYEACPICCVEKMQGYSAKKRETLVWHKNGHSFPIEYIATPITNDSEVVGVVITFNDITQKQADKCALEKLAHTDYLTGLINRVYFEELLQETIVEAKQQQSMFAVLSIDFNGFKNVNDTLGHHIGDLMLQKISSHMQKSIDEKTILARIGGDEFAVIYKDITSLEKIKGLARKLIGIITADYYIKTYILNVNASIGIAIFPYDGMNMTELTLSADVALYHAKSNSSMDMCFFEESLRINHNRKIELKRLIHKAMREKEFYFVFQPQINIKTKQVIGVESLLRLQPQGKQIIMPEEFIPIIHNDSLKFQFNLWCIKTAYKKWQELITLIGQPLTLAVNLSPTLFLNDHFMHGLQNLIEKQLINPELMIIEITESEVITQFDYIEKKLKRLHKMGFKIAIDDFGTGYSSFSRLNCLFADLIKLDYEFIKDLTTNVDRYKIIKAIIELAKNLDMTVIAEGIEKPEQVKALKEIGCEVVQGYFYAKPMTNRELKRFLEIDKSKYNK